jgi:hypothetical protein
MAFCTVLPINTMFSLISSNDALSIVASSWLQEHLSSCIILPSSFFGYLLFLLLKTFLFSSPYRSSQVCQFSSCDVKEEDIFPKEAQGVDLEDRGSKREKLRTEGKDKMGVAMQERRKKMK